MLNPSYFNPRHLPPIQVAIMKARSKLDEFRVQELYQAASRLFLDPRLTLAEEQDGRMWRSRVVTAEGFVVVTCTDEQTGLYIQLSGAPTSPANEAMLIFGQKFCQEGKDTTRQNIATKIWS